MTTQPEPGVRLAAKLAIAGIACVGVIGLVPMFESPTFRSAIDSLKSLCYLAIPGWLVGWSLLRGRGLAYWGYLTVWSPMVLLGGLVIVMIGIKSGFPITDSWPIDGVVYAGLILQVLAAIILLRPRNRPVVEPPASLENRAR